jgi:hypothetical protein
MRLPAILVALMVVLLTGCSSDETTTSTSSTSTVRPTTTSAPSTGGTSPSSGQPIPDSAAVDAITKDLTKPDAADLVAKCNAFATAFLANRVGGNEAAVMEALTSLADVVRPIDPAVAEALAGHAGAAAAWCRAKGMTNT